MFSVTFITACCIGLASAVLVYHLSGISLYLYIACYAEKVTLYTHVLKNKAIGMFDAYCMHAEIQLANNVLHFS